MTATINGHSVYPGITMPSATGLTPEDQNRLRQPFTAEAVKFRIQGKKTGRGSVRVLTYIDARLVTERLSDVDPNWTMDTPYFPAASASDPLGRKQENLPVIVSLTVKGVSRTDVGQNAPGWKDGDDSPADDKHVKMAVSDAIKRAAVHFGVGAYLYTLGEQYINEGEYGENNGKPSYINAKGMARLRSEYKKFIGTKAFLDRFGEALSYGDELAVSTDSVVQESSPPQGASKNTADTPAVSQKKVDEAQPAESIEGDVVTQLVLGLAKLTNRSVDSASKWIDGVVEDGVHKGGKKSRNLAAKQALKKAAIDGASEKDVKELLSEVGITGHVDDYLAHFTEAAKAAK